MATCGRAHATHRNDDKQGLLRRRLRDGAGLAVGTLVAEHGRGGGDERREVHEVDNVGHVALAWDEVPALIETGSPGDVPSLRTGEMTTAQATWARGAAGLKRERQRPDCGGRGN